MSDAATPFVALIPARLASTRLPDKPLADIGGKPMIVRVAEQAQRSGAHRVAVATDAPAIADAVEAAGFTAVLTRADHESGTDRLAQAARLLGLADDEIVVNVQGDEPLIPSGLIADVARLLAGSTDCAMATAAHPFDSQADLRNPNIVKVVLDARGRALYFSRAPIPHDRDGHGERLRAAGLPLRHIGIYGYRAGFLASYPGMSRSPLETIEMLEQLRALWHGHRIAVHMCADAPPAGVDTPEDLARVRAAVAAAASAATGRD